MRQWAKSDYQPFFAIERMALSIASCLSAGSFANIPAASKVFVDILLWVDFLNILVYNRHVYMKVIPFW